MNTTMNIQGTGFMVYLHGSKVVAVVQTNITRYKLTTRAFSFDNISSKVFTIRFQNSSLNMFFDGKKLSDAPQVSKGNYTFLPKQSYFGFLKNNDIDTVYFGSFDKFQLWKNALSEEEISKQSIRNGKWYSNYLSWK